MGKLKNAIVGFTALASTVAGSVEANAQQNAKRITETAQHTIVEIFNIRNGTSLPNTSGIKGYNNRSTQGTITFYDSTTQQSLSNSSYSSLTPSSIPNEQIGNSVFETLSNNKSSKGNFKNSANTITLDLTTIQEDSNRDGLTDGNTNIDLLQTKYFIPKTLNGGGAIPLNTRCIVKTRDGTDIDTGNIYGGQIIYLKRNGTARLPQATNREGYPGATYQTIGADGQLGVADYTLEAAKLAKVYPNPIHDSFSFDDGDDKKNEKLKYSFIDMSGKVIQSGTLTENQVETIQPQQPGMNILITEDSDGNKVSKKIIRK